MTVTNGVLSARQVEAEFMSIVHDSIWRWSAKQVADNKFIMRFPNAKMVQDFSKFKLGMKSVDAQITIEPWSFALGAKGKLQQAWFKVKGIPPDQRSIRTIAKAGGLVGKTVMIDEQTRFNSEFVRVKIACRDIYEVPESAECALGLFIYDFFYELEEPEVLEGGKQQQGIRIDTTEMQPSPKKQKTDLPKSSMDTGTPKKVNTASYNTGGYGYSASIGLSNIGLANTIPAKVGVGGKRLAESVVLTKEGATDDEIIPAAIYEPGESSEAKLTQEEESCENEIISGNIGENVWLAGCELNEHMSESDVLILKSKMTKKSSVVISELDETPSSLTTNDDVLTGEKTVLDVENLVNPCAQMVKDREGRRWSERAHKEREAKAALGQEESIKSIPSEGLYKVEVQGKILESVKIMLACAHTVLARQPPRALPPLPAASGENRDDDEEM